MKSQEDERHKLENSFVESSQMNKSDLKEKKDESYDKKVCS